MGTSHKLSQVISSHKHAFTPQIALASTGNKTLKARCFFSTSKKKVSICHMYIIYIVIYLSSLGTSASVQSFSHSGTRVRLPDTATCTN